VKIVSQKTLFWCFPLFLFLFFLFENLMVLPLCVESKKQVFTHPHRERRHSKVEKSWNRLQKKKDIGGKNSNATFFFLRTIS
jgi:hypothetical protein